MTQTEFDTFQRLRVSASSVERQVSLLIRPRVILILVMSIFDQNVVPTSHNTYAYPPPSYHHIVRDCASCGHAVKLRIVRNRRNTSTHAFSRRYQPSLPPLYAPVSSGCAAGAATRICRQPDRALDPGVGYSPRSPDFPAREGGRLVAAQGN